MKERDEWIKEWWNPDNKGPIFTFIFQFLFRPNNGRVRIEDLCEDSYKRFRESRLNK